MKTDLKERYLYAATKCLDPRIREDVSLELSGLMDDMLTERCGDRVPAEADIQAVIRELGTPAQLYARYADDGDACLIAQPYYGAYLTTLKFILPIVAVALAIAYLFLPLAEPRPILLLFSQWIRTELDVLVSVFTAMTLIFAYMSHKKLNIDGFFTSEDLPPVPSKKQEISLSDPIFNIAFILVFLLFFLAVPEAIPAKVGDLVIPCFDAAALRSRWYLPALFALVGMIREAVKLMERRWNRRVLAVTTVTDLLSAGLALWWLSGPSIVNPELLQNLHTVLEGDVVRVFEGFNALLMCSILLALTLEFVTTLLKTEKSPR